jgi:hypothetical protein
MLLNYNVLKELLIFFLTDSKLSITMFNNPEYLIFITNKECLKLVEKLKQRRVVTNPKPNGIFTAKSGL